MANGNSRSDLCAECGEAMLRDSLRPIDELVITERGDLIHARCEQPAPSARKVT
jgi:hypothetical protein